MMTLTVHSTPGLLSAPSPRTHDLRGRRVTRDKTRVVISNFKFRGFQIVSSVLLHVVGTVKFWVPRDLCRSY
jgi:hypothetical protein